MSIWQSRTIDATPFGEWRATDDDKVIVGGLTAEQAFKYQTGQLDYCDGCMELTAPFCGDHCSGCEAYCRKYYGACVDCSETAHTTSIDGQSRCMPHDREWEARAPLCAHDECDEHATDYSRYCAWHHDRAGERQDERNAEGI